MRLFIVIGIACNILIFGEASVWDHELCSSGPSYWCGNLWTARECNAVKHCIQTVWEKQILPDDKDDVCSICKEMVKEARDQLLSNETQEEIQEVFEGSCKLIPFDEIEKECIKMADNFIPEIIDTLASQMNPLAVCSTAGLCNNPFVDRIMKEHKEKKKSNDVVGPSNGATSCKDCKTFLNDVIQTVRRHSRADVLNHLLAICGRLSTLSEGCMALVKDNFQFIYNFLTTGLKPNDVCDLFGMCDKMYGGNLVQLPKTGDEPCDFCVAVVNSWRNNLVANTTREEFKTILDGICHQTGKFENECLSLVDQYFEMIYDVLISEIDPNEICKAVGLCGPNSVFNSDVPVWTSIEMRPKNHLPRVPLHPSFDENSLIGLDEANSYKHDIRLPEQPLSRNSIDVVVAGEKGLLRTDQSDKCMMCEFVLHFLQNVLHDDKTREEVEREVEKVCSLFPHTVKEQCQDYIEAYGDQLIQLIILEIDPSTICPMLNLCPGKSLQVTLNKDSSCVLCEFAMTEIDEILKDKSNEAAIKAAVEGVCAVMPKNIRKECRDFIDTYVDQIVDLLINDFTPSEICTQLGLCSNQGKNKIPDLPSPEKAQLPVSRYSVSLKYDDVKPKQDVGVKQALPCVMCELIVSKLEPWIINKKTEKELIKLVDSVCAMLPPTVMNNCLDFMDEYGRPFLDMLEKEISPKFICREIEVCKRSNLSKALPRAVIPFEVNKCLVCEKVINWVKVHDKSETQGDDPTLDIMRNVCDQFHGEAEELCTNLAGSYGSVLSKLLKELETEKKVCQALKMCPYHSPERLLGAEKCTWGPSYWCQSKVHAEACKATQHCEEKVWN